MRMFDIIRDKRDGGELTDEQIRFLIDGYVAGDIPDYQMSAFAMAVFYKGMTDREIAVLTDAMAVSGDTVDLSEFGEKTADKHSTGGVGDKTTLIVAPIAASLGAVIAKMSGRALGHTGGTVDKLESFTGYKTEMDRDEFLSIVRKTNIAVIGQSKDLAPADKKLYALRDVTATIDSVPLIASSIMSKKLAAGAHCIVLDVKVGSGAFLKTFDEAKLLAEKMVEIGKRNGRKVRALITNMDVPLGNAVGNLLEVKEAIRVLKGNGPEDLLQVCVELATHMVVLANGWSVEESRAKVLEAIATGKALEQLKIWIAAQGGDISGVEDEDAFPKSSIVEPIAASRSGYIAHMNAESIGSVSAILGEGRESKDDAIDLQAGITLEKKTGDYVSEGEIIAYLHTNRPHVLEEAKRRYTEAIEWSDEAPEKKPMIYAVVE